MNTVSMVERVGQFDIGFLGLPRRLQLVIVLVDVLVHAVEHDGIAYSRAAGGRFESRVAGDGVVGKDAAVAPAANAQAVWIGIAFLHRFIHGGQQVFHFMMTPVGKDRL